MPKTSVKLRTISRWLAGALVAAALIAPVTASAQVVVVANGSPITELDIQQRMKIMSTSGQKGASRQDVIKELIDDRIKISRAKVYGLEVSDSEVDSAFDGMAQRQHITTAQFAQVLESAPS
jgi:peptidyl-prolyl cis-trans isomerase SurA